MRRIRIQRKVLPPRRTLHDVLPLDARDPDVTRVKDAGRRRSGREQGAA